MNRRYGLGPEYREPAGQVYEYEDETEDPTVGVWDDIDERLDHQRLWSIPVTNFLASETGLREEGWVGERPLGFGTQSMIGLWRRDDADGPNVGS